MNRRLPKWGWWVVFAILLAASHAVQWRNARKRAALKPPGEVIKTPAFTREGVREGAPPLRVHIVDLAPKAGDTIAVVGKIAGAMHPFTEGFATAVVSDIALETCELIPGDNCETPWDACCVDKDIIKASRLTIQVVGEDSRPIAQSLKGVNGLTELDPIVVSGTVAEGSTAENLIVNVSSLYRRGD